MALLSTPWRTPRRKDTLRSMNMAWQEGVRSSQVHHWCPARGPIK